MPTGVFLWKEVENETPNHIQKDSARDESKKRNTIKNS